jgi:hypothetical protein
MVVQSERKVRIRVCLQACHNDTQRTAGFSRCASGGQTSAAKAVKLRGLLAASLKRCPDTNRIFPNCTIAENSLQSRVLVVRYFAGAG